MVQSAVQAVPLYSGKLTRISSLPSSFSLILTWWQYGLNCSENTCCSNGFNMAVNYSQQSAVASVPLVWKWALLECLLATYSQLHQLRVQHLHFHAYFSRPHSLLEVSWVFGYSFLPLIFSMTSTCDQTFHAGFYAVGQTAWVSFRL